jgi:alkylation response protein AidB-like acyl-CoA dehydrogenase
MDFGFTPEQDRLRHEVRTWLESNPPWPGAHGYTPYESADLGAEVELLRQVQARLAEQRFVGVNWPQEYGGRALSAVEAGIVSEELARADFPELVGRIGVNLVGPTLLDWGSDAQKARWLPSILSAQELWCQLFSEPGAGSDLTSLRTRAVRAPGGWVLTGQKVWTSFAQFADWGLCLARTDDESAGSRGITAFAVDMRAPGVTVRPLVQLTGSQEFNEVFLDVVHVPDERVIGPVGDGWRVATSTLSRERGVNLRQLVIHLQHLDEMFDLARREGLIDDPRTRDQLGRAFVEMHLFRMLSYKALATMSKEGSVGHVGSAVKLHWSEASKRMHRAALGMLGQHAVAGPTAAGVPGQGRWQDAWMYYLASSIWAGTNQLQRTIIAERVLGLPRERRRQPEGSQTHGR